MGSENETVADIVAEMRNESHAGDASCLEWVGAKIRGYADRIEAAMRHQFRDAAKMIPHEEVAISKMETTTQTSEKSSAVCNEAAMREALVAMVEAETCGTMERDYLCGRCLEMLFDRCKHDGSCWVDKVMNALAEAKGEAEDGK